MRNRSAFLSFCFACALTSLVLGAAPQQPPPETLKLQDLVGRPERWPDTITVKRELDFGSGGKIKAGQAVTILQYTGGPALGVDAGNNQLFEVEAADTDVLEAANAAWTKLTPEQKPLHARTVMADPSLWPTKVKSGDSFRLNNGKDIPPNTEFDLMTVEGNQVFLWLADEKSKLNSDVRNTDLVKRARERVAMKPDERPSRVVAAIGKDNLVGADGKPWGKQDLEKTKVFALYYGASWCGPCRQFSPSLVKYVNEVAAKHPELTVILISNDEKDADMLKYMNEEKMPWPAMPLSKFGASGVLQSYNKGEIPQLAIVDRHGKIIADCYPGGRRVNPQQPLNALKKHLDSASAAATK